jgi:prepilin-type N-terminal cleavage/methylation domain-containing protein
MVMSRTLSVMEPTGNRAGKERMRILSVGNDWRHPGSQEAGVTLLELVLVLAILSLAVSLVAPRFGNWSDEWTLRSAAEGVAQTVRYARTRALFEQSYYVVEIEPGAHLVRVFNPASGFLRAFALPRGVTVEDGENPPPAVVRLLLPPSGVVEERNLWLSNRRGSKFRVHVNFLLGTPAVEAVKQGSR